MDRSSRQWIVLDVNGKFWTVPVAEENPWDGRQPFAITEDAELERVPTHYVQTLGLPR